jgi:uncharacterized protein (DUF2267 family)
MASERTAKPRTRHAARVLKTSHEAAAVVREMTGLDDVTTALAALEIVAGGIVRRIMPREAYDFIAQLPSELHEALLDLPAGPDVNVTLQTIGAELTAGLSLDPDRAGALMRDVGMAIRNLVSRGEIEDVIAQLPAEMRVLLPDVVVHRTP